MNFLISISLLIASATLHRCVHDEMQKKVKLKVAHPHSLPPLRHFKHSISRSLEPHYEEHPHEDEAARILQSSDFRGIKFAVDYSNISPTIANATTLDYYQNTIFKQVISKFSSMLKVNGTNTIPAITQALCKTYIQIPDVYKNAPIKADYLVFVTIGNEPTKNYIAFATSCQTDAVSGKPNIGVVQINAAYIKLKPSDPKKTVRVIMHEFTHALGFSSTYFGKYPIGLDNTYVKSSITGTTKTYMKTPKLLAFARTHLNCPTLIGVPIEDEGESGSVGSHWEKNVAGCEYMVASACGNMYIGSLTLLLLGDTGWYQTNMNMAEQNNWGKNEGCDFVLGFCNPNFLEFCSTTLSWGCASDYTFKTLCSSSTFSNTCLLNDYQANMDCGNPYGEMTQGISNYKVEEGGKNSRCLYYKTTSLSMSGCFKTNCTGVGNTMTFNAWGQTYTCAKSGDLVKADIMTVTCPNLDDFCMKKNKCPNDCNGRGFCTINNECMCHYFWKGIDCSIPHDCLFGESSTLCDMIRPFPQSSIPSSSVGNSMPVVEQLPDTNIPTVTTLEKSNVQVEAQTSFTNNTTAPLGNPYSNSTNFTFSFGGLWNWVFGRSEILQFGLCLLSGLFFIW